MTNKKRKSFTQMTGKELEKATAEFEREFVADEFRPLDAITQQKWEKVKRKRGRPCQERGAKVISVSLARQLLEQTDRLAKRKGVSRAHLIARGLRAVLAAEEAE